MKIYFINLNRTHHDYISVRSLFSQTHKGTHTMVSVSHNPKTNSVRLPCKVCYRELRSITGIHDLSNSLLLLIFLLTHHFFILNSLSSSEQLPLKSTPLGALIMPFPLDTCSHDSQYIF